MGAATFTLGDGTTREQFAAEKEELRLAALVTGKAADALEMAKAHETTLAGAFKMKVLTYPPAVENKAGKHSDAMANCPHLADQRKPSQHKSTGSGTTTTGGTTGSLPTDVK